MIARRAGGFQRITSVDSAGVIHKLWVCHDGSRLHRRRLQCHIAPRIVVYEVVEVTIIRADRPGLLYDSPLRVIHHNVVRNHHVGSAINIDSTKDVIKYRVVGNRYCACPMEELQSKPSAAVDHVVPHVAAHVRVRDSMHARVERRPGADVVNRIGNGVIIRATRVGVVDSGSAIAPTYAGRNVMYVIADDTVVRSPIPHSHAAVCVAGQVKADDIDIGAVQPQYCVGRVAADLGSPLLIRDEADWRRSGSAIV